MITDNLNQELMDELKSKFDLQLSLPEGTKYSYEAVKLLDPVNMREFVDCYIPLMKALDDSAAAAYFANWFSNVALALQYSISWYDTAPALELDNLVIHLIPSDGYCRVAYSLQHWNLTAAPDESLEREQWRYESLASFYRDTAAPLLHTISVVSGLSADQIWGQLPTKFNYYLEVLSAEIGANSKLQRIQEDYHCLKSSLPPEIFGLSKNPFRVQVRKIEDIANPERTVQMRNRCCLFYRTEGGSYCYTCPRLKEEERAVRREQYRAKVNSGS